MRRNINTFNCLIRSRCSTLWTTNLVLTQSNKREKTGLSKGEVCVQQGMFYKVTARGIYLHVAILEVGHFYVNSSRGLLAWRKLFATFRTGVPNRSFRFTSGRPLVVQTYNPNICCYNHVGYLQWDADSEDGSALCSSGTSISTYLKSRCKTPKNRT
jgi:hypothetical protein